MEGGLVKDALSDERDDSRLLISAGMFSVAISGYLNVNVLYQGVEVCEGQTKRMRRRNAQDDTIDEIQATEEHFSQQSEKRYRTH